MPLPRDLTAEDVEPVMHLNLRPSQIATFEGTSHVVVKNWIRAGKFPEYSCQPGRGDFMVPVWSYLQFRKNQRVQVGEGVGQ